MRLRSGPEGLEGMVSPRLLPILAVSHCTPASSSPALVTNRALLSYSGEVLETNRLSLLPGDQGLLRDERMLL